MRLAGDRYSNTEYARKILCRSDRTPATPIVVAADIITGGKVFLWEYETTFDYLDDNNCLPNEMLRDQLLAGIAAVHSSSFLWDDRAFSAIAESFNSELAIPEIVDPLRPAQICYALDELNRLYSIYENATDLTPLYGESVKVFVAGCAAVHGFPKPPANLSFVSDVYHRFFDKPEDLADTATNPVLKRKEEEIAAYCSAMNKLSRDMLSQLKESGS
jgi:hypothetical protein